MLWEGGLSVSGGCKPEDEWFNDGTSPVVGLHGARRDGRRLRKSESESGEGLIVRHLPSQVREGANFR